MSGIQKQKIRINMELKTKQQQQQQKTKTKKKDLELLEEVAKERWCTRQKRRFDGGSGVKVHFGFDLVHQINNIFFC